MKILLKRREGFHVIHLDLRDLILRLRELSSNWKLSVDLISTKLTIRVDTIESNVEALQ